MGKSFDFKKESEELKKPPEFNDDSVWIVVDSSTSDPGKHYVFLEDRKDLAIECAKKCGWEYITDGSISNHLNRVDAINDGQTKISICRAKVTGWDPMSVFRVPPHPPTPEEEEQRTKEYQEKRKRKLLTDSHLIKEVENRLGDIKLQNIQVRDIGILIDFVLALLDLKDEDDE